MSYYVIGGFFICCELAVLKMLLKSKILFKNQFTLARFVSFNSDTIIATQCEKTSEKFNVSYNLAYFLT